MRGGEQVLQNIPLALVTNIIFDFGQLATVISVIYGYAAIGGLEIGTDREVTLDRVGQDDIDVLVNWRKDTFTPGSLDNPI